MKKSNLTPDFDNLLIGRNDSFRQSIYLGLLGGLFYAPTSLYEVLITPSFDLIFGVIKLIVGVFLWLVARVTYLICGFCGMVRLKVIAAPPPPSKDDPKPA